MEWGLEFDTGTCSIRAPREEFRNGSGPGAYLSGRRWGQATQVAVTRFVHVDSDNRRVSDEEEYKGT